MNSAGSARGGPGHRWSATWHSGGVGAGPALEERRAPPGTTYNNDYPGGYAQLMLLSAPLVVPVPNGLRPQLAALTEPLAVGARRRQIEPVQPGETAVASGAGRSDSRLSPHCASPGSKLSMVPTSLSAEELADL